MKLIGGKQVSWSTLFIIVVVIWFVAKANTGSGGGTGPTNHSPNPGSTVCNEHFKGGC